MGSIERSKEIATSFVPRTTGMGEGGSAARLGGGTRAHRAGQADARGDVRDGLGGLGKGTGANGDGTSARADAARGSRAHARGDDGVALAQTCCSPGDRVRARTRAGPRGGRAGRSRGGEHRDGHESERPVTRAGSRARAVVQ